MHVREKTALLATASNILLTALKFLAAFLTGSQAILAEALHSFSDVATSLFVFGSMRLDRQSAEAEGEGGTGPARLLPRWLTARLEEKIALGIGLFLLAVSGYLFWEIVYRKPAAIEYSLAGGLFFLLFALVSYGMSRFEANVGRAKGSMGLLADAQHQKSDMVGSLLTAAALFSYRFGVKSVFGLPVDKIAAFVIALFMASFGVETAFNAVRHLLRREVRGEIVFFRTRSIVGLLLQRETRNRILEFAEARLGVPIRGSRVLRALRVGVAVLIPLGLAGLYASTCFRVLQPDEEGILERFGRPVSKKALGPGLVVKYPWPIDSVRRVPAKRIRRQTVGFKGDDISPVLAWARRHAGLEAPFLSGDDKYFNSYIVIHYRIRDTYDYLYGFDEADRALDDYAYRIYTGTLARADFYTLATDRRAEGETSLASALQKALDGISAGLEVVSVNIKDIHPPTQVSPAYEAVVAAKQERERYINQAHGLRIMTLAQAEETRLNRLAEARSYVWRTVQHAEGIAENFLEQTRNHGDAASLTDLRLFLDAAKEALPKIRKVVVDPRTGRADLWLDLMELPENWGPRFEDEGPDEY